MVFRPDWLLQILNSLVPCSVPCSHSLGVLVYLGYLVSMVNVGKLVAIENSADMSVHTPLILHIYCTNLLPKIVENKAKNR